MSDEPASPRAAKWDGPWLDLLAFFGGLGMAWYFGWKTSDLIWSLWLSSLVVGFVLIVWGLGSRLKNNRTRGGGILLLAFFSIHFGLFHFLHSIILNIFFPLSSETGVPSLKAYAQVLANYWYFLPATFLAERRGFSMESTRNEDPINIIADAGSGFLQPYRNVIRMHVLILLFILVSFAKLENIYVYALVYAVYFFPWRLLAMEAAPVER
jgi:hypothetical protein